MDSLSQAALGAAVVVAVMQRRTAVWKAAAFGAVAGTLPDLDVFIDHGDAVLDMVLHRAETHALLWLTLFFLRLNLKCWTPMMSCCTPIKQQPISLASISEWPTPNN